MDTRRLANVIFDRGQKITQKKYSTICEAIENDRLTLDEYVVDYKTRDSFLGKIPFKLDDGSSVLVSESVISVIRSANVDHAQVESFANTSYDNLKKLLELCCKS